jgi:dipeptidyl aminopeptidase/acylaminoacyl peptidase
LLVHGDADKVLSFRQSQYFVDCAHKIDAPVEFLSVEDAGHGFARANHDSPGPWFSPKLGEIEQHTADFLIQKLTSD